MNPLTIEEQIQAVSKWMDIYFAEKQHLPRGVDADHSSLLRRLLEGKPALPCPPPRSYSYPNYSFIEDDGPWFVEGFPNPETNTFVICQTSSNILNSDGERHIISFSPNLPNFEIKKNRNSTNVFNEWILTRL